MCKIGPQKRLIKIGQTVPTHPGHNVVEFNTLHDDTWSQAAHIGIKAEGLKQFILLHIQSWGNVLQETST